MERRFPIRAILIAAAAPPVIAGALYGLSMICQPRYRCGRPLKVQNDLRTIVKVAELIRVETGSYPPSIAAMVNARGSDGVPLICSLDEIPRDPWGRAYEYWLVDGKPWARCRGADGLRGGEGEAADTVRALDDVRALPPNRRRRPSSRSLRSAMALTRRPGDVPAR